MGISKNWCKFISTCESRASAHKKVADFWAGFYQVSNLIAILFSAVSAGISMNNRAPPYAVAIVSSISALIASVVAFLRPSQRSQSHLDASKQFNSLQLSMVRCETYDEYNDLWKTFNDVVLEAPLIKVVKIEEDNSIQWTMTYKLELVVRQKEEQTKNLANVSYESGR